MTSPCQRHDLRNPKTRLPGRSAVLLGLLLLVLGQTAPVLAKGWKAGLAKAVLTPSTDVWLAGYGSRRVATETLHELWMKALALDDARAIDPHAV